MAKIERLAFKSQASRSKPRSIPKLQDLFAVSLAAKILARNTPSVTKLIEQLSIEKNPTVINTITESLIQNQEIKLTKAQANLVKEKILQESVNSIIGLSYLKLLMKTTTYNEENVSFIERLKSDHSLSEDTSNLITQWIENN
ncbi:hypothetical protein BC355_17770 [Vibrio cholerae]|uniref:Uncharacterized protein n=1 Tax=Vibrio cholerae TaxID=666 RepID=A0A395TEQ7_VIBCL|nr:hypothetical protein [Vibrio cholerae]RGP82889.1 hypothetical protein BC355_17770 [Vibrio cholerae]RGP82905.1 hypothetical protein BC353_17775 [Vibrio cholerae]